jgi:hypothetical protein
MRTQDVKVAADMASRYGDALEQVHVGQIPDRIREQFPREHVEDICRQVKLDPQYGDELVAIAMTLVAQLAIEGRPSGPKPSEVRDEIKTIANAARTLETCLREASDAARDACTVYTDREESGGEYTIAISEDPFAQALPALSRLIEQLDKAELPAGQSGRPISPVRVSLGVLKNILIEGTGRCESQDLQWLAEHVLEPFLQGDPPRWRELIRS